MLRKRFQTELPVPQPGDLREHDIPGGASSLLLEHKVFEIKRWEIRPNERQEPDCGGPCIPCKVLILSCGE